MGLTLRKTARRISRLKEVCAVIPPAYSCCQTPGLLMLSGKTAVGVLIDGLGSANRMSKDAQKNFDACVVSVTAGNQQPKQPKEAAQACAGSFSWAERRNSFILSALAEMVKDPPLPANTPPTAENFQTWKDWWAKNRNKAVFVIRPRASYNWH